MADQGSARSIFVGRWVRVLPVEQTAFPCQRSIAEGLVLGRGV